MKFSSRIISLTTLLGCCLLLASAARAESKVTISGTHLCCGACVKAVEKALGDIPGVKHEANQGGHTIALTAENDAAAQKAVDALAAAGFYGKTDSQTVKYKPIEIPSGKVKRLEVSGIHNCCGACNKAIKGAVKSVSGVTADTATPKQSTFVVEGDFSATDLVAALQSAGFHVQVKK